MAASADIITLPESTKQVQHIVNIANHYNLNIITRGQATNTTGATVPQNGGIVLSTSKLNKIIEINPQDKYAVVQPGVINQQLQLALEPHNLFWPPDPTSKKICTIGGNIACNAAGPSAVKYGVTRDHIMGLSFITGNGKFVQSGVYTSKGVVGYDFTRLLAGSEGTLGVITEAIVKLSPKPQFTDTIRAIYSSIEDATQAITEIMNSGVTPSALELLDHNCIKLLVNNSDLELPLTVKAILLIENNGNTSPLDSTQIIYNIANKKSPAHQTSQR